MAIPATPDNFNLQSGDGNAFLSWDITSGATTYLVQRSLDGVTFTLQATITGSPLNNYYLDLGSAMGGPVAGTQYYYQVAAMNTDGTSAYTDAQNTVVCDVGQISLGYARLSAQQKADQVNSQFVSLTEWNAYITESAKELRGLLAMSYGDDYYVAPPYTYTTSQNVQDYPLPKDHFKLLGVEVALNSGDPNSWVTLRRFEFIQRNLWNYPNVYTFYGITNLRYRVMGNNIRIVPVPQGGQTLRIWYVPRAPVLMADTDLIDGVNGWEEYVTVDAALKASAKQESDVTVLAAQKQAMVARLEAEAANRDIGEPNTVSDSKMRNFGWSGDDGGFSGNGGWGGV